MEKQYKIIPHADIYETQGDDAGDALVNFAMDMCGDMNAYFSVDEEGSILCPYDIEEAVSQIQEYARVNKITLSESIERVEVRGLNLSDVAKVIKEVNSLIERKREMPFIDESKFTKTTQVVQCFDTEGGKDVVCVDLVYDSSEELPVCDVVNICTLAETAENIAFAKKLTELIADTFNVPSYCDGENQ